MFAKTRTIALSAVLLTGLALSGCGTTPGDRFVSGGLLGAGTGAAIGSVTGHAGTGAVIGGVGGAALGALTAPQPRYYSYQQPGYYSYQQPGYYSYQPRCVRWSSYTGRCVEWD